MIHFTQKTTNGGFWQRWNICRILPLALTLLAGAGALAPESLLAAVTPELVGRWGYGRCEAVATSGNYAFFGSGTVLRIAALADPTAPEVVGEADVRGYVRDIVVRGGYAYVAAGKSGLRVVRVDDPVHPAEVGFFDTPGEAGRVVLSGDYAYVVDGSSGGVRIVDVSDPAYPAEVGHVSTSGQVTGLTVVGSYLYLATQYGGLRVIDVSDPANPVEVGSPLPYAYDVAVSGKYAYVEGSNSPWQHDLTVLDVTNPARPVPLDAYPWWASRMAIDGNRAYLIAGKQIRIVDLSDPAHLAELGTFQTASDAMDIALNGIHAYIAEKDKGLRIADISDPASPTEVGVFETSGNILGVSVAGDYAYLVDNDGSLLRVIDIRNPAQPVAAGSYRTPETAEEVAVSGNFAYAADGSHGLRIIDVSDPDHLVEIGYYSFSPYPTIAVAVAGNYAYVVDEDLRVLDVSRPEQPSLSGSYVSNNYYNAVAIQGPYAYLVDDYGSFSVIDVGDPSQPSQAASLPIWADSVAVNGNYGYLTYDYSGMRIIDIADPADPAEVAVWDPGRSPQAVAAEGRYAFIANGTGGLVAVDVSNPVSPVEAARVDTPGPALDLAALEGLVYCAEGECGLAIYRLAESVFPFPAPSRLKVTPAGPSALVLRWRDNSTGEAGFQIARRGVSRQAGWETVGIVGPMATFYRDEGLPPGVAYDYRVRATGAGGYSDWSNEAWGETPGAGFDAVIPAAAHVTGVNDTLWRSDVDLLNRGTAEAAVGIRLLKANQANPAPETATVAVPPGRCVRLRDALGGLFQSSNAALGLRYNGGNVCADSRFYNAGSACGGTYGMYIPAVDTPRALLGDGSLSGVFHHLSYTPGGAAGYRTNIGFASVCGFEVTVRIRLYDGSGTQVGEMAQPLLPYEHRQITRIHEYLQTPAVEAGWARVTVETVGGRVAAYAMVIDNISGDPVFYSPEFTDAVLGIPGAEPGGAGPSAAPLPPGPDGAIRGLYDLYIPAAAHTTGVNNTLWRTDVDLLNPTGDPGRVELALLRADQANGNPGTVTVEVPAGQCRRLPDLLAQTFHAGNAAVGIRRLQGRVLANARFYNTASECSGGTFGMGIPGTGEELLATPGSPAVFHHQSYDPSGVTGFRTNIGFVNASNFEVTVRITLYGDAGDVLAVTTQVLKPYEHRQFTRIHEHLQTPAVEAGWTMVETLTPGGAVHAYAMVIDNVSGDPVYMPALIVESAPGR